MKKNNKRAYKRLSTDTIRWKFLFYLFHLKSVIIRLWKLENIVEISIKRSEKIDFDAENGKIVFYQNDGERTGEVEIDNDYLNKIMGENKK